jgi:hypothetical protein
VAASGAKRPVLRRKVEIIVPAREDENCRGTADDGSRTTGQLNVACRPKSRVKAPNRNRSGNAFSHGPCPIQSSDREANTLQSVFSQPPSTK